MTKTFLAICAAGTVALAVPRGGMQPDMNKMTAETYEQLATAIIALRATEDSLVKGILVHAEVMAQHHLQAAMDADGSERASHLELAADEITSIANEGDKRIQAIRQRLLKAGHHHHTDADTEDDYMFVDSAEKRQLLAVARKVSKLGSGASNAQIGDVMEELEMLFDRVIASS